MKDLNKNFMDTESAIQRYIVGRMSNSEAEDFEAYFLANPELVEQVEIAQSISIGLANRPENIVSTDTASNKRDGTLFDKMVGWLTIPVPAFAVLALAAILSPLAFNGMSTVSPGQDQNIELLSFSTAATRSAKQQSVIDLSGVEGQAALMVKVKSIKHPNYKLKLVRDKDAETAWTSEAFQVGALRDHLVLLPSSLKGQKYRMEVVGVAPDLTESQVEFCHYSEVCN